jgi:hypothetical protein
MRNLFALFAVGLVVVVGCSSEAEPGESCDEPGKTEDVCESGYVCAKPSDSATNTVCIKTCTADADCGAGGSCNGVEGSSIKGCRIKG